MATSLRPRAGSSAKALLLTVLGEFVLPAGGWAWTATLVGALRTLDVDERNARQALGRLADQGIVRSERAGRRARWSLTDEGRALLVDGARRIYAFGAGTTAWDGQWLTVIVTAPGADRPTRHQFRSRLAFAGFGFLGPSVAVSPHLDREPVADAVLRSLGLADGAVVLRAELGDLVPPSELVRRAWDLESLAAAYRHFAAGPARAAPSTPPAHFASVVHLVHEWRRFPFLDAEIPAALLPPDWPGRSAKELFDRRHGEWAPGGRAHFAALEAAAAD